MTEQQIAPANANLEYSAKPPSFSGVFAEAFCTNPSSFVDPVDEGGVDAAISKRWEVDWCDRGEG